MAIRWLMAVSSALAISSLISIVTVAGALALTLSYYLATASLAVFVLGLITLRWRGLWLGIPTMITVAIPILIIVYIGSALVGNSN